MPILEVKDLSVSFIQYTSGLRQQNLQVINNLNVSVEKGEILAIIGSSGSGKSLLAHAILGILPNNAQVGGQILYKGKRLTQERQQDLRGKEIAFIPQSVNFLDPLMKVGKQVQTAVNHGDAIAAQRKAFERQNLAPHVEAMYPFQLSGGMARRVLVSTAIVSGAEVIIADEPTPGLDDKVIQEAMGSFRELANQGKAVILISHDIEMALQIADKIAVFYAGTTLEVAPVADFTNDGEGLRHPYSKALWKALPQNGFQPIGGSQPMPNQLPEGCLFQPRCKCFSHECISNRPDTRELRGGLVRCNHAC
ncbi:peptide ABC transporter ATP-binding protein [Desulfuribacillus stibiiarsenatis]|uniref:Nickel import system ATP-binding protein NikD n=1 Tax=Desulfuribacillus stibiiarsenatis TaxID=1390249 RepID=A0A1E5L8I8_9FIRM|nr:ABC transporter ATP-binding protein [Desulfuribacillus stibiiarsenatis]OEH86451.1 peptide ABC transporter ATP-binding protein [Desulfuribacillus stibiiarsenatis]